MKTQSEADIQKQILDYLEVKGYVVWRNFVGPVIRTRGDKQIFTKNKMAGLPDIIGVCKSVPGKMFAIEVKTAKGKASERQEEWLLKLSKSGATVFIARDLRPVMAAIKNGDI